MPPPTSRRPPPPSVTVGPGELWTLTTHAGGAKGVHPAPPPPAPFPAKYADNFDKCAVSQEAEYWTDQARQMG